jgi:hypothetical protein
MPGQQDIQNLPATSRQPGYGETTWHIRILVEGPVSLAARADADFSNIRPFP